LSSPFAAKPCNKKPTNGEKFVDFVIFFSKSFKKINKPG
jgi:hypothetical protein